MRKLIMSLMQLMLPLWIMAQADVSGKVIDAEENEPLVGVSVIIKDSCGKIIKFATTKADGSFFMQGPMIEGSILEAMMMGYAKQSMPIDSLAFPLTITMKSEAIRLKEVSVKADRIREQGDTITYYCCITSYMDDAPTEYFGLNQAALEHVVDMDALENCRDCEVNGVAAVIGELDGHTYLRWTISPTYSCALEYTTGSVSEADILRMAESVGEPER